MRRLARVPRFLLSIATLAVVVAAAASAQNPPPRQTGGIPPNANPPTAASTPSSASQRQQPPERLLPAESVTSHTLTVNGRAINYTARASALPLTDDKGVQTAEVFYVAYTVAGGDAARRPITFAFNGGPGAASAYLHLGALGPRAVDFGDGRSPPGAGNGAIVDNPDTWLPFTDLVFVDPVGTGYSHAMRDVKDTAKTFWGVRQDLDALSQTIRRALVKLDRVGSPVYLAGESYGGFRAARLVGRLPTEQGIAVRGAVLVSPVLEFSLQGGNDVDPLPWALRLPSYAAVNLENQGKLSESALADAERFALTDYVAALIAPQGDAQRRSDLYARIAAFTGLPETVVARWNGRVPGSVFVKEIRHDKNEVASSYDAAVLGDDPYPSSPTPRGADPIFEGIIAPLTTAFVSYARNELQYRTDRRYRLLNGEVSRKWEWGSRGPSGTVGAGDDLRRALALNPRLKVVIDHGMTDVVTPYMTSRFVVDHLPEALTKDRVALKLYPGGHMMYLRPASRAALKTDAQAIYGGD
jgi:carboxypeptidase C (cathepsin A)